MLALALVLAAAPVESAHTLELGLTPISAQLNGVDREHFGSSARLTWRPHRLIGVYFGGVYHWLNRPSPAMDVLDETQRIDVFRPLPTLLTWSASIGLESIPLSGELHVGPLEGRMGLAVSAGLGPAGARVRLAPELATAPARWASVDVRLVGHGAAAWRLEFGALAITLGLRATFWNDSVSHVNGCSIDDLRTLDGQVRAGQGPDLGTVTRGCTFDATNDIPLMLNVVRDPSTAWALNLAGEFGVAWSFF
ncbi:MAG: hypothetical protein U0228_28375 [Myxococcaceae bacterium]